MTVTVDHVFPSFSERHSSFEKFGEISRESIQLFEEKSESSLLSDLLITFWREYGEGRFSDGLLNICDPCKKKFVSDFFFPEKNLFPILISSFGDLFVTDFKQIYFATPSYGWCMRKSPNFELLFEISLWREEFLNDVLNQKLHRQATQKLGLLAPNEIFGFEPAIALGGNDEDINSVKKFQMDAHLAFLSQLVELEER